MGATYNTGQDCTAATRVYVAREVYGEAVEALRATLERHHGWATPGTRPPTSAR